MKLPPDTVLAILQAEGTAPEIARSLGVCAGAVRAARRLETDMARAVAASLHGYTPWPPAIGRPKITAADVAAIKADPRSSPKVARDYGITDGMVRMIRTGRAYKDTLK